MKRLLAFLVFLFAFLGPQVLHADPVKIQWAGVSFLSPPGEQTSLAPILDRLLTDPATRSKLDQRIKEALAGVDAASPNWELATERERQGDDSYMLTFAIALENAETVSSGGLSSTSYEIQVSVLVANLSKDASRQRIVTNYPVRVRFNTIDENPQDPRRHASAFEAMLLSPTAEMPDLVDLWAARARDIELREKKVWLRVAPLSFGSEARAALDRLAVSPDDQEILQQIQLQGSALLEAQISEKLDIPVIPFGAKGMESMMLHFANVDASESFKPPNPDFSIVVDIRALRHAVTQSLSAGGNALEQQVFGGAFVVSLVSEISDPSQPGENRDPPPLQLRRIDATDRYAAGTRQLATLPQFRKLVSNFSNELGQVFSRTDPNWFKTARSELETRDAKKLAGIVNDFGRRLSNN